MMKPFEFHGVEAEKAEAMRRYNNRKTYRNILRTAAVALLVYLWFPTVAISLQIAGDWFYRTGIVIITNRTVVFVFANLLVGLIFLLSRESSSNTESDLYDQCTVVSAENLEDDDSNKQIVPAVIEDVKVVVVEAEAEAVTTDVKGTFRRTKSENKKKIFRPMKEFRRTESAKVVAMERMNSEEFRLEVERFIMEKKMNLVH